VRHVIAFLLFFCALSSRAAEPYSHIEASYDVMKDNIKAATITETFSRTKDHYHIESVSKAFGLVALFKPETIRVVSDGSINAKGLRPASFTNKRELDSERNASADFNWALDQITLTDRNGTRTLALPEGTQDRLSAMYQFMYAPVNKAAKLDFYMTNGSKVDIYNYIVTHNESVTVPLGTFKATYVTNQPKENESRTEIWLSTEHENFPYKMVITGPEGDKFTQLLTRFNATP
jgi:Protein of unknown function (DUF3108)